MKVAAVIAEYNPFHNGHEYQLRKIRQISGADFIVVLMSGDYVQRGEPAIVDKYVRAEMALVCGADLVLEMPVAVSTGSAGDFAFGAVAILKKLGCVDELWFGGESADLTLFERCSEILAEEPEKYKQVFAQRMAAGDNYPTARAQALQSILRSEIDDNCDVGEFLRGSNNILGLEYCLAIKKLQAHNMVPRVLQRVGSAYLDTKVDGTFVSAMAIRQNLDSENVASMIPEKAYTLWKEYIGKYGVICLDDFSDMLCYQLQKENAESITAYKDINQDLGNRILSNIDQFTSITQFAEMITSKNKTKTAVQRALLHILLQVKAGNNSAADLVDPFYVRVLGFRKDQPLMNAIKHNGTIRLVTKASKLLEEDSAEDVFASKLYENTRARKTATSVRKELARQIVVVK